MPKLINWEPIKRAYLGSNDSLETVAAAFGVSERAIKEQAKKGNWRAEKLATNVVAIERKPKEKQSKPQRKPVVVAEEKARTTIEYLDDLEIVNMALSDVSAMLGMTQDAKGMGGLATALVRLLEFRRKVAPPTAIELAEQMIALNISPAELVRELKRLGWQQSA